MRVRIPIERMNPVTLEALRLQAQGDHRGLRSLAASVRAARNDDDDSDTDTIPVHERLTDRIRAATTSSTDTIPDSETETLVSRIRRQRQQERGR